jgi:hypothetical protein
MKMLAATAIAVGLAAAGARDASLATAYRGPCGTSQLAAGPAGLPAAVKISTRCGTFLVERSGRVVQAKQKQTRNERIAPWSNALLIHSVDTGVKTVYLTRSGQADPRPVYSHHTRFGLWFGLCEETPLRWRGAWVLYASSEGHLAAIDRRTERLIDLTGLLARLPGGRTKVRGRVTATAHWT